MVVMKNLHSKLKDGTSTAYLHVACHIAMWQGHREGLGKADMEALP